MTFTHAWVDLTRSTARLLVASPAAEGNLRGRERDETLAARDAVVGGLRSLTSVLVGASRPAEMLPARAVVADPAYALHDALCGIPQAGTAEVAPSDTLARGRGPWAVAGRAAVGLEMYHEQVRQLSGSSAWALLRDIAEVASALPHLDADLAFRLPQGTQPRDALQDPETHGFLRLAAGELLYQLPPADSRQYHNDLVRKSVRAMLLRSPADLPQGLRRLAVVLPAVGPDIAAVDVRSIARVLAETTEAAAEARVLSRAVAADALAGFRGAAIGRMATLSTRDARICFLTTEAHRQLSRLSGPDAHAILRACVPKLMQATDALTAAVESAGRAGRLLGRPDEGASVPRRHLLWVPVPTCDLPGLPVVSALVAASQALSRGDEGRSGCGLEPRTAAERAAQEAARAGAHLRAVLAARRASPVALGRSRANLRALPTTRHPARRPRPRPL